MPFRLKESARDIGVVLSIFVLVLITVSVIAFSMNSLELPIWASSLAAQLVFIGIPLATIKLFRNGRRELGLSLTTHDLVRVSLISISVAIAVICIISSIPEDGGGQPELIEDPVLLAILTLLVAPPCEEMFFRGLLQGYMLSRRYFKLSIILPALLFSIMHVIPFQSAGPATLSAILAGALALGLIAGYFRATSGSLLHAVLAHFLFNLVGYVVMMI